MWFDTHAHIYYLKNQSMDECIRAALSHGVKGIVVPGVDKKTNSQAVECTGLAEMIWAGVGFHPNDCNNLIEQDWQQLEMQIQHQKVVAIGETGLDYYRSQDKGMMKAQQESFTRHCQLAKTYQKPLIVHTRQAKEDTLINLRDCYKEGVTGILHCFSEDLSMAEQAVDLGFYISFSGIITFNKADALRQVMSALPRDKVLIETDCPFLAPVPHRGHENQPAYVSCVGQTVAHLWQVSEEQAQQQLWQNSLKIFNLNK